MDCWVTIEGEHPPHAREPLDENLFDDLSKCYDGLLPGSSLFYLGELNVFQAHAQLLALCREDPDVLLDVRTDRAMKITERITRKCYGSELDAFCNNLADRLTLQAFTGSKVERWFINRSEFCPLDAGHMIVAKNEYDRCVAGSLAANPLRWEMYMQEISKAVVTMLSSGMTPPEVVERFGLNLSQVISLSESEENLQKCKETKLNPPVAANILPSCMIL